MADILDIKAQERHLCVNQTIAVPSFDTDGCEDTGFHEDTPMPWLSWWRRTPDALHPSNAPKGRFPFPLHHPSRFVVRCVLSATLSYWLALLAHLANPVWAPMSALIVSQETLAATRASVRGRFAGTLLGVAAALTAHAIAIRVPTFSLTAQMAAAVAVCALCARGRPAMRACLWTVPLVLLGAEPDTTDFLTAISRSVEVVLGALVGGACHDAEDRIARAVALWHRFWRVTRRRLPAPPGGYAC